MAECIETTDDFPEKWIPSDDVRRTIRETGKKFTDFEKAVIIYHLNISYMEKRKELQKLQNITQNEELKKQLAERIRYDEECMAVYAGDSSGYVYALIPEEKGERDICGYFSDPDLACLIGKKSGCGFLIEKHRIFDWKDVGTDSLQNEKRDSFAGIQGGPEIAEGYDKAVSWSSFNAEGELMDFGSEETEKENPGKVSGIGDSRRFRFENAYIEIPNPFDRGDIVRVVVGRKNVRDGKAERASEENLGSTKDKVGIIATTQTEWNNRNMSENLGTQGWPEEWYDYGDASIIINFPDEDGDFWHEHWNPFFLERCALPEGKDGERLLELKKVMLREPHGEYAELMKKYSFAVTGKEGSEDDAD